MRLYPRINDVSTDLDDPPMAEGWPPLPDDVKEKIREGYPDIGTLTSETESREELFNRALEIATRWRGWIIEEVDRKGFTFRGVAISPVFRFRDDFVLRVTIADDDNDEGGSGARLDMRSRSRIGNADYGANAERIASFFEYLQVTDEPT